ncbi:MAG TPA: VOC family protein [Thermoanaerobaculia bacterium]
MVEMTRYEPGTFCWVELATSDAEAAKRFYTSLFGWTFDDRPGGGGIYTLLLRNGKEVAALYGMSPQEGGIPPHWNSYVSVEKADDAASRARELGGSVLMGPFDVMEHGRMAVVQDPAGATFSVWEPKAHIGARIVNEPGSFCWNELYTTDPRRASDFYSKLFGWTREARHMDFGDYVIFEMSGRMMAGMMQVPKEWGPVPPHWLVYFAVDDCDATVAKARGLGAGVTVEPMDVESVGRFALLTDPQRAGFAVIKFRTP